MLKDVFKSCLILIIGCLLIVVGLALTLYYTFNNDYDVRDLTENFEQNKIEIREAKDYYLSVLPENYDAHIEFDRDGNLHIFHLYSDDFSTNNFNLQLNSDKTDSLLKVMKITKKTLDTLCGKLKNAGCVSVSDTSPVTLGAQRSGMGMYKYLLFDKELNREEQSSYNDSCNYIYYDSNVVFSYGGGAVGAQCFPEFN